MINIYDIYYSFTIVLMI